MTEPVLSAPAPTRLAQATLAPPVLVARPELVVCHECDAVHARVSLDHGTVARCSRCNALLGRSRVLRSNTLIAFALASLILILIGNSVPIVTLDLNGVVVPATLPRAIEATWQAGQPVVALLTAATAQVFPLCFLALRLHVLWALSQGKQPRAFVPTMHALEFVTRWAMVEVFMLGTLVSVVRCASLTSATPGIGLFAYAAATLLLTTLTAAGTHGLWARGAELGPGAE